MNRYLVVVQIGSTQHEIRLTAKNSIEARINACRYYTGSRAVDCQELA